MNEKIKVEIVKPSGDKAAAANTNIEQLKCLYKDAGWWSEDDNTEPDLISKLMQGSFCFAVASINDSLVGMGRAISDGVSDAYIQDVAVLSKFRGRGIGILIMDELINYLKSKKINWIGLISEPKAHSFYQRYGFSRMAGYVPFILK